MRIIQGCQTFWNIWLILIYIATAILFIFFGNGTQNVTHQILENCNLQNPCRMKNQLHPAKKRKKCHNFILRLLSE